MSLVLQCLFSWSIDQPFYVGCNNSTNDSIATAYGSASDTDSSSITTDSADNCQTTQCLSYKSIRISYFVGGSIILLLVLAVVILSILLCFVTFCCRKQRKKRGSRHFTEEGLSTADEALSQSANYTLEDSFESVHAVEDSNTLDTVVNNKYDTIELKRKASSAERDKENEAAPQASSTKKKNKKKAKKNARDLDKKKNPEYNKLVHGPDSKGPVGIDKDSYSVLDKPKKVVQEVVEVTNKGKELPIPPSRQNEISQNALGIKSQVIRLDPYEEVPSVVGEAKKEGLSDADDQTKTEKVYYNESAALVSKIVQATENGKHETEERRLNIYTHSISL